MKSTNAFYVSAAVLCALFSTAKSCGCGTPLPQDPFDPLGAWHQRHLECGIPPFAYRLPQDAQAKIHAIWLKYQAGDDCEDEQHATQEIIVGIAEEERMRVFKGMCGPGFLANASSEAREAYQSVWFDDTLDIDAKKAAFVSLAAQHLNGEQTTKFKKFKANLEEAMKRRREMIDGFSPVARDAYNKWIALRREERAFLTGLPMEVRIELGLVCKCCGGCTAPSSHDNTHHHHHAKAAVHRRARRQASVTALAGALQRADRHMLAEAVNIECQY